MKLSLLNRKVHYWLAAVAALPVVIIIVTGFFLQWKKQLSWVQPAEMRGGPAAPALNLPQILEAARAVPEAKVREWSDLYRVEYRPGRNLVKVITKGAWELQLDAGTGALLHSAPRRFETILRLHEGEYFHDAVKLWVFFPAALCLFVLWVTGLWMFFQPFLRKSPPPAP